MPCKFEYVRPRSGDKILNARVVSDRQSRILNCIIIHVNALREVPARRRGGNYPGAMAKKGSAKNSEIYYIL